MTFERNNKYSCNKYNFQYLKYNQKNNLNTKVYVYVWKE